MDCTCACHLPGTRIVGEHECCGAENDHPDRHPEPRAIDGPQVSWSRPIVNEMALKAAPRDYRDAVEAARKKRRR